MSNFIFRIAIWNRNMVASLIAIGIWSGGLALNIRRTFSILSCSHHHLISRICACEGLTTVRRFTRIFIFIVQPDAHANCTRSLGHTVPSRVPVFSCIHTGALSMPSAFSWPTLCSSWQCSLGFCEPVTGMQLVYGSCFTSR
jgi:hypothetical protein